jgi:hypothetical protein
MKAHRKMLSTYKFDLQMLNDIVDKDGKRRTMELEIKGRSMAQNIFDLYKDKLIRSGDRTLRKPTSEFFYYYAFILTLLQANLREKQLKK